MQKTNGVQINYIYGADGNRILKTVNDTTEAYVRDANGNIMAVYKKAATGILQQTEIKLYGSSHLGIVSGQTIVPQTIMLSGSFGNATVSSFTRGEKEYMLTDHRGNNMATITDRRMQYSAGGSLVDYYLADVKAASYYSSYGAISNSYNGDSIKYAYNGQRRSTEISTTAQTALYWEYNGDVGRRWNVDPRPSQGSPYSAFNGNPIWFSDVLGDSSVIDNRGYIVHYDAKDKDLRVFMQQDGKLALLGELGNKDKPIESSVWFKNLLQDNSKESKAIWTINPWGFKNRVRQYGKWDYKYRSPANKDEDGEVNKMPYHILGIAFYRKDKENGTGDLSETYFTFDGNTGRAEDLNNYHFGVVGKAYNIFSEEFMLRTAGQVEMNKWADDYKHGKRPTPQVPASWRPVIGIEFTRGEDGKGGIQDKIGPPYGDNPIDHDFIKRGFKYYDVHKKELLGN